MSHLGPKCYAKVKDHHFKVIIENIFENFL